MEGRLSREADGNTWCTRNREIKHEENLCLLLL
jgi:hypothetical protein